MIHVVPFNGTDSIKFDFTSNLCEATGGVSMSYASGAVRKKTIIQGNNPLLSASLSCGLWQDPHLINAAPNFLIFTCTKTHWLCYYGLMTLSHWQTAEKKKKNSLSTTSFLYRDIKLWHNNKDKIPSSTQSGKMIANIDLDVTAVGNVVHVCRIFFLPWGGPLLPWLCH